MTSVLNKALIEDVAEARRLEWSVEVVPDPDAVLLDLEGEEIVASADARILDGVRRVCPLASIAVEGIEGRWVVEL